jgi:hypothetical protein
MTEAEIKAEMRLWALECLVCQLGAIMFQLLPGNGAQLALQALLDGAKKNVFPGVHPALSDHYAAEFESATQRLAKMLREYMESAG